MANTLKQVTLFNNKSSFNCSGRITQEKLIENMFSSILLEKLKNHIAIPKKDLETLIISVKNEYMKNKHPSGIIKIKKFEKPVVSSETTLEKLKDIYKKNSLVMNSSKALLHLRKLNSTN